ncbi:hypothetical protein EJ06DRAFT_527659 [Trichodelitschia bisporula]|uniref:Uncharacterized protein n=1 Tax=Trichodelitschia bisporula TaxID=703511 RepID=A0A6G1I3B8_9PEZI|nr:hypothetical protein EJ06DRAFT_527659 [Trichodelitschia bisporula]
MPICRVNILFLPRAASPHLSIHLLPAPPFDSDPPTALPRHQSDPPRLPYPAVNGATPHHE